MTSKMISKWNAMASGAGLSREASGGHGEYGGSLLGDHAPMNDGDHAGEHGEGADSLGYNNMLLRADGTVMTKEHIRELRERQGFCLTCEAEPVKLFAIKKSKLNPLWKGREAINTIHVSYDGHCLRCDPHLDPHRASRAPENARNSMIPGTLHTMLPNGPAPGRRRASVGGPMTRGANPMAMAAAAAAAAAGFGDDDLGVSAKRAPSPPPRSTSASANNSRSSWSPVRPPQRTMSLHPPNRGASGTLTGASLSSSGRGPHTRSDIKLSSGSSGRLTPPRMGSGKGLQGYDSGGSTRSASRLGGTPPQRSMDDSTLSRSDHSKGGGSGRLGGKPKRANSSDGMLESTDEEGARQWGADGGSKWDDFAKFLNAPPGGHKVDKDAAVANAAQAFKSQLAGVLGDRRKTLERSSSIDSDGFLEEPGKEGDKIDSTDLGFNSSFMHFSNSGGTGGGSLKSGASGEDGDIMNFLDSDKNKASSDDGFGTSAFPTGEVFQEKPLRRSKSDDGFPSDTGSIVSEMEDTTEGLKYDVEDSPVSPAKGRRRTAEMDTMSMQSVEEHDAEWQDEMADDMDLIKGTLSSLASNAGDRLTAIEKQVDALVQNQTALMEQTATILKLLQAGTAPSAPSQKVAPPQAAASEPVDQTTTSTPKKENGFQPARVLPGPASLEGLTALRASIPSDETTPATGEETQQKTGNLKSPLVVDTETIKPDDDKEDGSELLMMNSLPTPDKEKKRGSTRSSSRKKLRNLEGVLQRSKRSSRGFQADSPRAAEGVVDLRESLDDTPSGATTDEANKVEGFNVAEGEVTKVAEAENTDRPSDFDMFNSAMAEATDGSTCEKSEEAEDKTTPSGIEFPADPEPFVAPVEEAPQSSNRTTHDELKPVQSVEFAPEIDYVDQSRHMPLRVHSELTKPPSDPKLALVESGLVPSTSSSHTELSGDSLFSKANSDPLMDVQGEEDLSEEKETLSAISGHSQGESIKSDDYQRETMSARSSHSNTDSINSAGLPAPVPLGQCERRESKRHSKSDRKEKKKEKKREKKEKRKSSKIRPAEEQTVTTGEAVPSFSTFGRIEEHQ